MPYWTAFDDIFGDFDPAPIDTIAFGLPGHAANRMDNPPRAKIWAILGHMGRPKRRIRSRYDPIG